MMIPRDYSVHSDLLIHWTGSDIDECDSQWQQHGVSTECLPEIDNKYLKRLSDILTYGLWMTLEAKHDLDLGSGQKQTAPECSRICFTELKLSESRRHASRYGRLGIGVKRKFLFDRGGRPVIYYGPIDYLQKDSFLRGCADQLEDKRLLHFFKPMDMPKDDMFNPKGDSFNYEYYAESEWRIIYTDNAPIENLAITATDTAPSPYSEYIKGLQREDRAKVKHLVPLDEWLSCIIYPTVSIKNTAVADRIIRTAILEAKKRDDPQRKVPRHNVPAWEFGNWPIEIDLNMCSNF